MDDDEIEEFEMEVIEPSEYEPSERRRGSIAEILPGYATAVAMEGHESTVLRSSTGMYMACMDSRGCSTSIVLSRVL